jgi:hypothetical protein
MLIDGAVAKSIEKDTLILSVHYAIAAKVLTAGSDLSPSGSEKNKNSATDFT